MLICLYAVVDRSFGPSRRTLTYQVVFFDRLLSPFGGLSSRSNPSIGYKEARRRLATDARFTATRNPRRSCMGPPGFIHFTTY